MYSNIINSSSEIAMLPEIKFLTPWEKNMMDLIRINNHLKGDSDVKKFADLLWSGAIKADFWNEIQRGEIFIDKENFINKIKNTDRSPRNVLKTLMDIYVEHEGKKIGGAKFPVHFSYTPLLSKYFPDAKILHIIRDPRATSISHAKSQLKWIKKRKPTYGFDFLIYKFLILHGVFEWGWDYNIYAKYNNSENYFTSCFEDLLENPSENINKICNFLQINFNDKMLYPQLIDSSYKTKYKTKQKKGFDNETLNRWKNNISSFDKFWITLLTQNKMKKYGYNFK